MKTQSKTYQLVLSIPDSDPILYRLEGKRIRLGRDSGNQIQVAVKAISAAHCEFQLDDEAGRCELVDLGSTNGTKVNGSSVKDGKFALRNGDQILLGGAVTVQFIQAIEAAVRERRAVTKPKEETKPISPVNPVAAAVAQQQAALQAREAEKRNKRKRARVFGIF